MRGLHNVDRCYLTERNKQSLYLINCYVVWHIADVDIHSYILLVPALSDFGIAINTVYWYAVARFKGYFRRYTTLGTYCRIHLGAVARTYSTICPSCLTACWAAFGFVEVAFAPEVFLFISRRYKNIATFKTPERYICEAH